MTIHDCIAQANTLRGFFGCFPETAQRQNAENTFLQSCYYHYYSFCQSNLGIKINPGLIHQRCRSHFENKWADQIERRFNDLKDWMSKEYFEEIHSLHIIASVIAQKLVEVFFIPETESLQPAMQKISQNLCDDLAEKTAIPNLGFVPNIEKKGRIKNINENDSLAHFSWIQLGTGMLLFAFGVILWKKVNPKTPSFNLSTSKYLVSAIPISNDNGLRQAAAALISIGTYLLI